MMPPSMYFKLFVTLLFSNLFNFSIAFCPIKCHCDDSILLTDCTGGLLDLVPITLNPQLRELHLAANQIKSIKETLSFYNDLLFLDLSDNQLQTLGSKNFNQLRTLKILKIGNNRLSLLSNQTFAGLINLQQLYLPHNELLSIHNDAFKQLNRLRLLDMSHNALINLQSDVFASLTTLELLNLSHNRFDGKISNSIFHQLSSLKVLHLDHNPLRQMPDFLFRSLIQLHTLTLNYCELRNLNHNSFFGLGNLRYLKISYNQFNQLAIDVFLYLENLENLELQGTSLLQLPDVFGLLKSLKHVSLGYDRFLKQLTSNLFNQNVKLQSIAIENCPSLEQLPAGLFSAQQQLVLINLRRNALATLSSNVFSNYSLIQRLILTGNPLHCDCNLSWLFSSHALRADKLMTVDLVKKLYFSKEDADQLEKIMENWSGRKIDNLSDKIQLERIEDYKTKYQLHHKIVNNFKQNHHLKSEILKNEIDLNSNEYLDSQLNINYQRNANSLPHQQSDYLLEKDRSDQLIAQTRTNDETATCFEPLALVGRPLIELTSAGQNCNNNHMNHQSIMINGEKINFENRNPAMVVTFEDQYQLNGNNKDQYNGENLLNSNISSGLNSFILYFLIIFIVCLILFAILFTYIYFERHKTKQQPISSWILKPGASQNNATLSFQPFTSFDMNRPKCNTLVNPLAKLGPLPKKPLNSPLINQNNLSFANNFNSSPVNTSCSHNTTLISKINLKPQITKISNLINSTDINSSEITNIKHYEQVNYNEFEEQIYEDPLVDEKSDSNMANNYGYQQLNSTTSTASSYLSNGLNQPNTYEEFLVASMSKSTPNSYGTLNSQTNRLLNTNFSNNTNFNHTNNRRTINTVAHF